MSIRSELFATLLSLIEHPEDPRAGKLLRRFECASVAELLRSLVREDHAGRGADLEQEIYDALAADESEPDR